MKSVVLALLGHFPAISDLCRHLIILLHSSFDKSIGVLGCKASTSTPALALNDIPVFLLKQNTQKNEMEIGTENRNITE